VVGVAVGGDGDGRTVGPGAEQQGGDVEAVPDAERDAGSYGGGGGGCLADEQDGWQGFFVGCVFAECVEVGEGVFVQDAGAV
jgi:hypothetical protein